MCKLLEQTNDESWFFPQRPLETKEVFVTGPSNLFMEGKNVVVSVKELNPRT